MNDQVESNAPEALADQEMPQDATVVTMQTPSAADVAASSNGSEPADAQADEKAEQALEDVIDQLRAELETERARADELLDKFQRTAAEFQNARRRQEKQMAEEVERASSHMIRRLLPVMDDFELAFQNVPSTTTDEENAWLGGFRQIHKKLQAIFDDEGVKPVAVDGAFDPTRHEAVTSEPSDNVESGHIISTLRMGYEHKGRVLRPALVRVAA